LRDSLIDLGYQIATGNSQGIDPSRGLTRDPLGGDQSSSPWIDFLLSIVKNLRQVWLQVKIPEEVAEVAILSIDRVATCLFKVKSKSTIIMS
jgi:hypothetical protein